MKDIVQSIFASVKKRIDKARLENRDPNLLTSIVWALRKLFPRDWYELPVVGSNRHPGWWRVRNEHVAEHGECEACGTTENLEVHHEVPVHVDPSRELDRSNLFTLCRVHHFWLGHGGDYTKWNKDVRKDAAWFREMVTRIREST